MLRQAVVTDAGLLQSNASAVLHPKVQAIPHLTDPLTVFEVKLKSIHCLLLSNAILLESPELFI